MLLFSTLMYCKSERDSNQSASSSAAWRKLWDKSRERRAVRLPSVAHSESVILLRLRLRRWRDRSEESFQTEQVSKNEPRKLFPGRYSETTALSPLQVTPYQLHTPTVLEPQFV